MSGAQLEPLLMLAPEAVEAGRIKVPRWAPWPSSRTSLYSGLVRCWPFWDGSGGSLAELRNGVNGTFGEGDLAPTWQEGPSLLFDGSKLQRVTAPPRCPASNDWTVAIRLKLTALEFYGFTMPWGEIDLEWCNRGRSLWLGHLDGGYVVDGWICSLDHTTPINSFPLGEWCNIVWTSTSGDPNVMAIYIDGVPQVLWDANFQNSGFNQFGTPDYSTITDVLFGSYYTTYGLNGCIDSVYEWSRPLMGDEVLALQADWWEISSGTRSAIPYIRRV
jgi:hypothetical protein